MTKPLASCVLFSLSFSDQNRLIFFQMNLFLCLLNYFLYTYTLKKKSAKYYLHVFYKSTSCLFCSMMMQWLLFSYWIFSCACSLYYLLAESYTTFFSFFRHKLEMTDKGFTQNVSCKTVNQEDDFNISKDKSFLWCR